MGGNVHTGSPREQFTEENLQRIKPVERLGVGAMRDALIVITLAEIPQSNLVKIMQPDRTRNTVDKEGIGHGKRNDMGEVKSEEVGVADHRLIGNATNADEKQEYPSQEEEQRAKDLMPYHRRPFPPGARWAMLWWGGLWFLLAGGRPAEEGHRVGGRRFSRERGEYIERV